MLVWWRGEIGRILEDQGSFPLGSGLVRFHRPGRLPGYDSVIVRREDVIVLAEAMARGHFPWMV